jgi:hypothetical protein
MAAPAHRGGSGLSLCLASAGVVKTLSIAAFTLVWTHSIEKVEWQEDWRLTPQGLELVQARVKGSGAGMEPPADARLVDGWFQWRPARADAGTGARQFRRRRRMAIMQRWKLPNIVGDFRASDRGKRYDDERV